MNNLYMDNSISKNALYCFLKNAKSDGNDVHSMIIYNNTKMIAKVGIPPYSLTQKQQVYSLSKSFASTAIGIAIDEGLINVDDKVCDIFEDKCPEKVSENLENMTVHNLLSMNSGNSSCVFCDVAHSEDGVKTFLGEDIAFKPGTHFAYNTAASYMLSAIIKRVTGMSLLDYLYIKLFCLLDILPEKWHSCAGDINEGGVGLFLSCEDIIKLGLLYLNNGVYKGKRLLSEKWVKAASSIQSDNKRNGMPDWTSGYGYQFWMNSKYGYRGDGAFGQFCIVMPEKNLTIALLTECRNMPSMLRSVYELVDNLFMPYKDTADFNFEKYVSDYYPPLLYGHIGRRINLTYIAEKNVQGISLINIEVQKRCVVLILSDGTNLHKITFGNGKWVKNEVSIYAFKPTLAAFMPKSRTETANFFASCLIRDKGEITAQLRYFNCPHLIGMSICFDEKNINIKLICNERLLQPGANEIKGTTI